MGYWWRGRRRCISPSSFFMGMFRSPRLSLWRVRWIGWWRGRSSSPSLLMFISFSSLISPGSPTRDVWYCPLLSNLQGSRGRSTQGVLCCLLVNSTPKVWVSLAIFWIIFWCLVPGGQLLGDRVWPADGDSWISLEFSLSSSNDRWLDGRCPVIGRLEVSFSPICPVDGDCPVAGDRGLVAGDQACLVCRMCLLLHWATGRRSVGRLWEAWWPLPSGLWPVDLYSLGYKYPGSCHQYGSFPG